MSCDGRSLNNDQAPFEHRSHISRTDSQFVQLSLLEYCRGLSTLLSPRVCKIHQHCSRFPRRNTRSHRGSAAAPIHQSARIRATLEAIRTDNGCNHEPSNLPPQTQARQRHLLLMSHHGASPHSAFPTHLAPALPTSHFALRTSHFAQHLVRLYVVPCTLSTLCVSELRLP